MAVTFSTRPPAWKDISRSPVEKTSLKLLARSRMQGSIKVGELGNGAAEAAGMDFFHANELLGVIDGEIAEEEDVDRGED